MKVIRHAVGLLAVMSGVGFAGILGQEVSTNRMELIVLPEAGSSLIELSTNLVTLQVVNLFDFSSIRVQARILPSGKRFPFWDSIQPSQPQFDGIFQGNYEIPNLELDEEIRIEFHVEADDITESRLNPRYFQTNFVHRLKVLVRPPNDGFQDAFVIPVAPGEALQDNTLATLEHGETIESFDVEAGSIWYVFEPLTRGVLKLTPPTRPIASCQLSIYAGSALSNLRLLRTSDPWESGNSGIGIEEPVMSGQRYYVRILGLNSAGGVVGFKHEFTSKSGWYYLTTENSPGGNVSEMSGFHPAGAGIGLAALPEFDFHFAGWEGDVSGRHNPLAIKLDQDKKVRARFVPAAYTDDFETRGASAPAWVLRGSAKWFIQNEMYSNGHAALKSGPITDGEWCSASLTVTNQMGRGMFDFRTSTESGWDTLEFRLNDRVLGSWSGQSSWTTFHFTVPKGVNTFTWRYSKDSNFSAEIDAAFLDNLYVPGPEPTVPRSAKLNLLNMGDGAVLVHLNGDWQKSHTIQYSTDFTAWVNALTSQSANGSIWMTVTPTNLVPVGFYRARSH